MKAASGKSILIFNHRIAQDPDQPRLILPPSNAVYPRAYGDIRHQRFISVR